MSTIQQDGSGGFVITAGKTTILQGAAAGAVKLFNQFRLFKGSWFRDQRVGVPYLPAIFAIKNPDLNVIRQIVRSIVLNTPGVKAADTSVAFNPGTRQADIKFTAKWDSGATITATALDKPFLVNIPQGNA